jgi:hypothetical protein
VKRWQVPAALAATVVISASVTLLVRDEQRRAESPATPAPAPIQSAPAPEAEPTAAALPAPAETAATAPLASRMPDAPRAEVLSARAQASGSAGLHQAGRGGQLAPTPRVAPAQPSAAMPTSSAEIPSAAVAKEDQTGAGDAGRETEIARPSEPALDDLRKAEEPARLVKQVQELAGGAEHEEADSKAKLSGRRRDAPAGPAVSALPAAVGDVQTRTEPSKPGAAEHTPEEWIKQIRRLRAQNLTKAADESLREFKKRYPDYVLPDDLKPR